MYKINKIDFMRNYLLLLIFLFCCSCVKTEAFTSISIGKEQNVRIGDTLVVVPELPAVVDSVSYYWESQPLQILREMPFVLHYKIENEAQGTYKLKYQVHYPNGYQLHTITVNVQ